MVIGNPLLFFFVLCFRILLQEIYELVDADLYLPCTSDISSYMGTKPSSFTVSYSSDGMTISSSSFARWAFLNTYSTPKVVELELKSHTSTAPEFDFVVNPIVYCEFKNTKTSIDLNGTSFNVDSTLGKWRFEVTGTQIKAYKENTLVGTINATISTLALAIGVSGGRNCTIKDLIIKAL